jgi:hypothetical protein
MARKRPPAADALQNARSSLAIGAELSGSDRAALAKAADSQLNVRARGRPIKDLEKKQLATLMMASLPPGKPPSGEIFEHIATRVGLSFEQVKHVYRDYVLRIHRIRARVIGAPRRPDGRAIRNSVKKIRNK